MKLTNIREMTGGAGGGTTSGANFSPTDSKGGLFVGGTTQKLYKRRVKKEGAGGFIKHKTPSSAGKTHSLTYGSQDLKVFNKSQPDSAGSFYQKIQKLF
jgi:hypothetical protein